MSTSIIIPTLQAAETLPATLQSLNNDCEIVVVDGGSTDETVNIATNFGARVVSTDRGRGLQLATGAAVASGDWLLFLHADTRLEDGWADAVQEFTAIPDNLDEVAVFTFALDTDEPQARKLEQVVSWRTRWLGLPYGDQGLLISRYNYVQLDGFSPIPLMEDVALMRKVSRSNLTQLPMRAVTSAKRWQQDGWTLRSLKNLFCLGLYYLGASPQRIQKLYR